MMIAIVHKVSWGLSAFLTALSGCLYAQPAQETTEKIASTCPSVFCREDVIARQQVYQSKHWRVFVDYRPVVKGHLLSLPKEHKKTRHELSREEHNDLYDVQQKIRAVMTRHFGEKIEDIQYEKNGPIAGQSVLHFHIHFLPVGSENETIFAKLTLFVRIAIPWIARPLAAKQLQKEQQVFTDLFQKNG